MVDVRDRRLLSAEHIDARLAAIDMERASRDAASRCGAAGRPSRSPEPTPRRGLVERAMDTSYVCVVDRWGNAFSATPSDGAFDPPVDPRPGHRAVHPRRPVAARPAPPVRRRPRQAPAPDAEPGASRCATTARCSVRLPRRRHAGAGDAPGVPEHVPLRDGRAGGDQRAALLDLELPRLLRAVRVPPGLFAVEDRFPDAVLADLARAATGRAVARVHARAAAVEAIHLDAATGFLRAGADPRQPAYAIAD